MCEKDIYEDAFRIGEIIAEKKYTLVCGGLGGVMEAAAKGAKSKKGLTVGILPSSNKNYANKYIDIPISTNMGHARKIIIAHTADKLIAVGGEYGTLSEVAIGLKLGKKVFSWKSWDIKGVFPLKKIDELREIL